MLGSSSFSTVADGRRESRKRRRLSERRRIFSRLGLGSTNNNNDDIDQDTRRPSALNYANSPASNRIKSPRHQTDYDQSLDVVLSKSKQQQQQQKYRAESPVLIGGGRAGDQGKISMKIQFHITVAPDNEPLILDPATYGGFSAGVASLLTTNIADSDPQQQQQQHEHQSTFSRQRASISSIGEQIHEKLSRQSTLSTRRRQQLMAMHNQSALDNTNNTNNNGDKKGNGDKIPDEKVTEMHSEHNIARCRSDSSAAAIPMLGCRESVSSASRINPSTINDNSTPSGKSGARSSTISGGMQDEATLDFLAKHQIGAHRALSANFSQNSSISHHQQHNNNNHHHRRNHLHQHNHYATGFRQHSASVAGTGTGSLASNHSTRLSSGGKTMASQREQIYFKRDGQRFGHEFTLKLAVDKSYRCLLKVRPLIPLQAISIQGHHVAFVDCSTNPCAQLSSSEPVSTSSLNQSLQSISGYGTRQTGSSAASGRMTRNQQLYSSTHSTSINSSSGSSNSTASSSGCGGTGTGSGNYHATRNRSLASGSSSTAPNVHHQARLSQPAQTTLAISLAERRLSSALMATLPVGAAASGSMTPPSPLGGGGELPTMTMTASSKHLQQLLLRQQQHSQMMRHFAASHCSPSGSHLGGQLIYMFDWSAGRFEVNKNKARTTLQTVLKFDNGQIVSLPLQVKFYEPEARQHLNWGNQLHFIDYDCNINNMGQIEVDKVQFY